MLNYNEKIDILDITNSAKNALSIFTLAKTQKNNIGKKYDDNFIDLLFVCEETSTIIRENKATKLIGKAKKADLEIRLNNKGLLAFYSQLGKNDITAVKKIGIDPQLFHDAYYEKDTKVDSLRGIVSLAPTEEKDKKSIEEIIENFIKSNTTKKDDDEKVNILEITLMFNKIAEKMHKEKNSNIVDMLPSKKDIAVNE
tara:strand:+ start:115 stop:708 length:594 start_codon:yes stop_codon:yes gene_type:complete